MNLKLITAVTAIVLLGCAAAFGHHAFSAEFDVNKPINFKGTLTEVEFINPHSWFHIDVKGPDGKVQSWMIEAGTPNTLLRRGFTKESLQPVAATVARMVKRPVAFAGDCVGAKTETAVAAMKPGDILCLENTRFHKGEEKNDPAFVAELAKLGDLWVNDAFSAAHRAHASTVGVTKHLPAYAGLLMEREVAVLTSLLTLAFYPRLLLAAAGKEW